VIGKLRVLKKNRSTQKKKIVSIWGEDNSKTGEIEEGDVEKLELKGPEGKGGNSSLRSQAVRWRGSGNGGAHLREVIRKEGRRERGEFKLRSKARRRPHAFSR